MSLVDRTTKLRWRRRFRRSKKQVEDFGTQAEQNIEQHFFKRLSRLTRVRRFIAAWVLLFILLIGGVLYQTRVLGDYYLQPAAAAGGIYTEGILGAFTNANPIYVASSVDNSVERLVFSGLFKYDQNNNLVGDLAEGYSVDARGTTYTVTLRKNITWHDGAPVTADDVVYTYGIIQTPDAKSPLFTSWNGIKVQKVDTRVVSFTLPSLLTSFPHSLTNGLIPRHILKDVPAAQMRSIVFNTTQPVGTGPFKWDAVEVVGTDPEEREQRIGLVPFDNYVGGRPKIEKFIVRTFPSEDKLTAALQDREVNAAAGLSVMPEQLTKDISLREFNIPLSSEVFAFYRTSSPVFTDAVVRRALNYAINNTDVIEGIGRPVSPVTGPLLRGQIGFDPSVIQNTNNPALAAQLLDQAGFTLNAQGKRFKGTQPLAFTITTQDDNIYKNVAQTLRKQWESLGAEVDIISLSDQDLQVTLSPRGHTYDVLLYGIALGADPDVFAYWHSSQAAATSSTRLNFSEYQSTAADKSLEAGRTRPEADVRASKYKAFLTAWRDDAPAVALYQPRYLYIAREPLFGFSPSLLNSGADRLNAVNEWMIRQSRQPAP